ncbi:hypothetical protein FJ955_01990 [Mesorhizobium sp. B2-2-2]|uniref:hypothetical protein n=1 Tax=Mesorhizobium sp. B2-2-2 TaxID=2589964 RepID=UPI0011276989|nr:hypothetical protein [Mesorhizobium sp. B2-2-2]TPM33542.1 hypothetical protein FJ955_01990 [Mesorhizobium sp. B2-2-2]
MTTGPVPCEANAELRKRIEAFAETLKTEAHKLGAHGLDENEFYQSGLFRGAIERLRGQFSAAMREKRDFVKLVLNYMQDQGVIKDWASAGDANRHDYVVELNDGRKSAIELKGCLDGNNTNIFERPPHVQEFVIWSVCSNPGADPRHNVWSGIHTRLSAEIISREQRVDGLIVWDWICGTLGRPCPKAMLGASTITTVGQFELPPPCIYLFPGTIPSPRNNPKPPAQTIKQVGILDAFHTCFGGQDEHLNSVEFEVAYAGAETMRTTTITRDGVVVRQSAATPIQRS